jgi:hypothetical protein
MQDFEKLGVFYLGREYDLQNKKLKEELLLYDAKDLVTHAVCVGMTGSGKTGLCIGLLEEAALDSIPAIIVDPKGDLSNLLLTFPSLKPQDFLPWINETDAQKKGLSPQEYAHKQSEFWKSGLADWAQDEKRIQRLRDAAEFVIYTPGSNAGIPLSILKSFSTPEKVIREDSDLLRERVNTTVTSLLNLLGIEADPIQSREHILLSTLLNSAWNQAQDLDLAGLIQAIQSPPVSKIGVFDLESFFPSNDRFSLAMKLNNLLAAPGFNAWLEGEPLDINHMLYSPKGKPKVSVLSIAHLNDAERMFFVSLLLTQLLGWMRTQSGTTSLRALFYMDEIFGYFPPVANPPSKAPLLTLLKQARAFGLGIVLATQNPVDLDYKGLSNTGTWFIGRLQTERDKQRVIDGLEGAGSSEGGRFDRRKMEQVLAGLGKRVFLMNNVHEDAPVLFHTRWVMSYLRGPLTRNQIKQLMDPIKKKLPVSHETAQPEPAPVKIQKTKASKKHSKPVLPPDIPEHFLPVSSEMPEGTALFYEPMLFAVGSIYYADAKIGVTAEKTLSLLAEFPARSSRIEWKNAQAVDFSEDYLEHMPDEESSFGELPKQAGLKKNYSSWRKSFKDWLYRHHRLELLKSQSLSVVSGPDESERDFRIRLQQIAREKRDILVERVRTKYATKIAGIEEKIRKAEQTVDREKEQAKEQKLQAVISFGATLLTALTGRKKMSRSTLGRATTTVRGAGRAMKQATDIKRAKENLEVLEEQLSALQTASSKEIERVKTGIDPLTEELEIHSIKPKKMNIAVSLLALTWVPYWQDKKGRIIPARE